MAAQTFSASANLDDAAKLGLLNGETVTIDTGATLTVDADNRWSQQAAVIGSVTISSVSGGKFLIDSSKVWQVPFTASSGNVPTLSAVGTQDSTGGTSSATGEFLGVWATGELVPRTAGSGMPSTGYVKFRSIVGTFDAVSETITLPGGATITSAGSGVRSWIHVVGASLGTVTVPRLGEWSINDGSTYWYDLGTTNGADDQTFDLPFLDNLPAFQIETSPGSGTYEWWLNAGSRWGTATQFVPTDERGKFFGQWKTITNAGSTSGSAVVTTTDTTGLEVGMPVHASVGWAALSSLYIVSINPGVSFTVNTNANATSAVVTIKSPGKTITIAQRASASCGYKPASGCKVRIPNVILSQSITGWAGQTAQRTTTDRWETLTTAAGVIRWGGCVCNIYLNASAPYSVSVRDTCFDSTLTVANTASTTEFTNCAVGVSSDLQLTSSTFANLFTGLTLNGYKACRFAGASAGHVAILVQDSANVSLTDCYGMEFGSTTAVTRGNADIRCISIIRCVNTTALRSTIMGGRFYVEASTGATITDTAFADQINGTTVSTNALVGAINIGASANIFIDGFSAYAGLANIHPYAAILTVASSSSNVEFRNLGTASAPYDCGSSNATGVIVTATVTLGVTLRRLYAVNTRTSALSLANTVQNVDVNNVWCDPGDTQAIASVAAIMRGCRWTNSTTGQSAVYGRHWEDAFTSTTAGRLLIACNEPLAGTADQCSATAGTPLFNSAGNVVMPTIGDQVTWTMPYFMLGITSFTNSAPTITGTNTGNITLEFQWDTGAGWNGSWLSLTGANLSGVGAISPTTGVKLKVRATTATANATNALTYIRINTDTNSTDQQTQYPLPVIAVPATVQWTEAGSRVRVYNVTTATELYNDIPAGLTLDQSYTEGVEATIGDEIQIRVRKAGFEPLQLAAFATAGGWSAYAPQVVDGHYSATTPANVTVDYVNQQIRATSTRDEFTAQELVDIIGNAQPTVDGIRLPEFAEISGLVELSPGVFTAITVNLIDWQVSWAAASVPQAFLSGGNVVGGVAGDPVEDVVGGPQVTIQLSQAGTTIAVGGVAPTESQIKTWVRAELATEMARIDAAVTSRASATDAAAIKASTGLIPALL
jgi:hypothetical protein